MRTPAVTSPPVQSDLERLRGQTCKTAEEEKARLKKATREFEAFFMYELLKNMRKTIPENSLAGDAPMSGSMGKSTYTQMFDMEIGRRVATGGPGSISDILFRSLEKVVEAKYRKIDAADRDGPIPLDRNDVKPVELKETVPLKREEERIELPKQHPISPILPSARPVGEDPIISRFGDLIDQAAAAHKLDSALITSVIRAESGGRPDAVSPAGAKGLMQLMDGTAAEMGVSDSLDPRQNIAGGSRYLASLMERFGDLKLALAAYNAGPGTVEKYGGVPPYRETRDYVEKVTRLFEQTRSLARTNGE